MSVDEKADSMTCSLCNSSEFFTFDIDISHPPQPLDTSSIVKSLVIMFDKLARHSSGKQNFNRGFFRFAQNDINRWLKELGITKKIVSSEISNHSLRYVYDLNEENEDNEESSIVISLRNILPKDHPLFVEMNKDYNYSAISRLKELQKLAETRRKFSQETKRWLSKNSLFSDVEFPTKLENLLGLNEIKTRISQPLDKKGIICIKCGFEGHFYDIENQIDFFMENLQTWQEIERQLSRYESSLINWKREDKKKKDEKTKARNEQKRLEKIQNLEDERRRVEEKIRELRGED